MSVSWLGEDAASSSQTPERLALLLLMWLQTEDLIRVCCKQRSHVEKEGYDPLVQVSSSAI